MKKNIWALFDDRKGSVGQAKGIIQALDDTFCVIEKNIVYNRLAALPNWLRRATLIGVDLTKSAPLKGEDFPDAVLSTSRRTLPVALWIKKKSGGKTKIIQLMYPGKFGFDQIDLDIISEHDRGKANGENIMYITGCPHRVFPHTLEEAKAKWDPVFAHLPKPWTAVIIGGAIKNKPFTAQNASLLAERILQLHEIVSGSLLITTSRRTGEEAQKLIMDKIGHIPAYTYLWGEEKENPIMGFYACADRIIVTGDSVSMACESCGTGKPVIVFKGNKWLTPKHLKFVQSLCDGKYAIDMDQPGVMEFTPQKSLNPSAEIAKKIKGLF